MVGVLDDVEDRVTSAFKTEGDIVALVGETLEELGASEAHFLLTGRDEGEVPVLDFEREKRLHSFLFEAAKKRLPASAHDCAEGGLSAALAESAIQGNLGVTLDWTDGGLSDAAALFGESQSRAVVSVPPDKWEETRALLEKHGLPYTRLGQTGGRKFSVRRNGTLSIECDLDELARLWDGGIEEVMKEEAPK